MKFEWVTPPPAESVVRALESLVNTGMLSQEDARLTEVGSKAAEVPVDISVARMVRPCPSVSRTHFILSSLALGQQGLQMRRRSADYCSHGDSSGRLPWLITLFMQINFVNRIYSSFPKALLERWLNLKGESSPPKKGYDPLAHPCRVSC